jgi:hypothetical protein
MNVMDIEIKLKSAFSKIEETREFKEIDKNISNIFYTLYLRVKRIFHAILILKNCDDENISYVETLPLFRILIENYFHICYVTSEKDTEKVKEGYELLAKYSHHLIARKMQHNNNLEGLDKEFVQLFKDKFDLPKEYEFLTEPGKLARKTGKEVLYRKHYSILNSFIHFNPSTFINYGDFVDGAFIFNVPNKQQEKHVYRLIFELMYLILGEVVIYLNNEELNQWFSDLHEDILKYIETFEAS